MNDSLSENKCWRENFCFQNYDKPKFRNLISCQAPDIRKKSATLIATMFRHSPPVFSSILNTVTEAEQVTVIVFIFLSIDQNSELHLRCPKVALPMNLCFKTSFVLYKSSWTNSFLSQGQCVMLLQETVPNMMSQESEVLMGYPGYNKIVSDRQSATSEESASLFDAINQRFLVFH